MNSNLFNAETIEKANEAFENTWKSVLELVNETKLIPQTQFAARRLLSYNPQEKSVEKKCPELYIAINSLCSTITNRIQMLSQSENPDYWIDLLFCYLMMNDMPNSYTAVAHTLRLQPKVKDPYFNYCAAIVYHHFHYFEDAINFYKAVPDFFDQINDRNLRLAIAYRSINKFQESENLFRNLIKKPPKNLTQDDIKLQLAYTLQLAEKNSEAAKIYDELYSNYSWCKELKQQYVWFLSLQNDSRSWTKADELIGNSTDSVMRFASARIAMKQSDMAMAYQRYRDCTASWSDSPLFWCGLGVLYLKNEQFGDAIVAFQRALYLKNDISEAWLNLGLIFELQREPENAAKIYQTAQSNCASTQIIKRLNECGKRVLQKENLINEVIEIDGNRLFIQPMERISDALVADTPFLSDSCFNHDKSITQHLQNLIQYHTSLLH